MTPTADKAEEKSPKPEARPGPKPEAKDDLKTLPMPEVEKRLGFSPDGLSSGRGAKAAGPGWP